MKNKFVLNAFIGVVILAVSCSKQVDYEAQFSSKIVLIELAGVTIESTISSGQELELRGLIYSTDSILSIDKNSTYNSTGHVSYVTKILDETNSENKTFTLNSLELGTQYYYKLFAVFNGLVKYGEVNSFQSHCGTTECGPAGGAVIYSDGNGGGIEVARYSTGRAAWGCSNTLVGTSAAIGSGQANTNSILALCGTNTHAYNCDNYEQNGFTDYYMPSKKEMELIYSKIIVEAGNPYNWQSNTAYHTSTEYPSSSSDCYGQGFNGVMTKYSKSENYYYTIPVRSF